jgi:hypothetical protein
MPMRYAPQPDVLAHLNINTSSSEAIARVTALENGLADAFDAKVGRSFGVAPVAAERTITAPGVSTLLVVLGGIRSVTGITTGGTWDGAMWLTPEILDADDYALWATDRDGISYGIESFIGAWVGPVHVTGIWADQSTESVPADIREAMTFLTVRQYRRLTASPTDLVGPDGMTVPTPHAWDDPLVKTAIERHRLVEVVI